MPVLDQVQDEESGIQKYLHSLDGHLRLRLRGLNHHTTCPAFAGVKTTRLAGGLSFPQAVDLRN